MLLCSNFSLQQSELRPELLKLKSIAQQVRLRGLVIGYKAAEAGVKPALIFIPKW